MLEVQSNPEKTLASASIDFRILKREWFRDVGGDMGEFLSGIAVETEDDYMRVAKALGIPEEEALQKLSSWSDSHLPDLEGYPIQVSYETHFDPNDSDPTDVDQFSLLD